MWEEERGRQRGGIERGRKRMEVESECVKVWEGERGRHIGGIENVCERAWEGDRGIHRGGIKSLCARVSVLQCGREKEEDI
jgi:hypothetical protein